MNNYHNLLLAGIAAMLLGGAADARLVKSWTHSELLERSEIVVVGKPTSVRATGKTGTIQLGKNPPVPVIFYSAKVDVIATIKGKKVAKEITIIYSNVDPEETPVLANGPSRVWLKEGKQFLLYLKKGDGDAYVGVLNGDYDDGQASKLLSKRNRRTGAGGKRAVASPVSLRSGTVDLALPQL